MARIITNDLPRYFAVLTRIRQDVGSIGEKGGVISSTVVPQVQAIFPDGALTKTIRVGLQVSGQLVNVPNFISNLLCSIVF